MQTESNIAGVTTDSKQPTLWEIGQTRPTDAYWKHVQTYSQRALTKRTDVFDAISAILTSLYGQTGHLFGLPKKSFDEALLWSASIAPVSNPDGRLFQSEERVIPTWSWGSVVSPVYEMEEKFYGSLVKWSFLDGSNMEPLEAIEDPRTWGEPNALARI